MELFATKVKAEWLDYNQHMNAGYYAVVFNLAVERFLEILELDERSVHAGVGSAFALECHLTYQHELKEGDPIRVTVQLLDYDDKRIHFFLRMHHAEQGFLAATFEEISIYVDLSTRRSAPIPALVREKLDHLHRAQQSIPRPPEVGRVIGIRRGGGDSLRDPGG
jgi:acyl-CoA thioester hydrolase